MSAKTALITGAGSGIGKAIALAVTELVDSFVLVGRDTGKLEALGQELQQYRKQVHVLRADLAVQPNLLQLQAFIDRNLDRLDILVHSAGVIRSGSVGEMGCEDMDWHYAVNLRGPVALTQMCLPLLRVSGGQVVFINSSAGLGAKPGLAGYCASKAALRAFADSLRAEENPNGVRVLSIYPGRTATPMQAALFSREGKEYIPEALLQASDVAQSVVSALAMPETAEVTDVMIRGMRKT